LIEKKFPLQVKVEKSLLGGRMFAQCCFVVADKVIGDFDQAMLFGNLELATSDLIERLKGLPGYDFKNTGNVEEVFNGMRLAFLQGDFGFFEKIPDYMKRYELSSDKFSAIPLAVEAFDGEEAFLFRFNESWLFSWRQWASGEINSIALDRDAFAAQLELALKS